jgi:hypothetical protein
LRVVCSGRPMNLPSLPMSFSGSALANIIIIGQVNPDR